MAWVVLCQEEHEICYLTLSRKGVSRWTTNPKEAYKFLTQKRGLTAAIIPRIIATDHGEMAEIVCRQEMRIG